MKIAQKSWPQRDMGTSKFSAELLSAWKQNPSLCYKCI
jgi:hypothetical protein